MSKPLNKTIDTVSGAIGMVWDWLGKPTEKVPGCTLGEGACPPGIACENCNPPPDSPAELPQRQRPVRIPAHVVDTTGKVLP